MNSSTIICADCLAAMPEMAADSVDSIVTDPPYGLKFMGKDWDHGVPGVAFWREALRVAKPGAHLLAFGGDRTHHRLMVAIEDAGWEIRTCVYWVFGQGFPKSLDVSKAIDKAAGAERERNVLPNARSRLHGDRPWMDDPDHRFQSSVPLTAAARQWDGWGTALKPAVEIIVLARKPLSEPTVAANVLKWGTGALNIDACRIGTESTPRKDPRNGNLVNAHMEMRPWMRERIAAGEPLKGDFAGNKGRFPSTLIHDGSEEVVGMFPSANGGTASGYNRERSKDAAIPAGCAGGTIKSGVHFGDSGSAARFFYAAKSSKEDRNNGLDKCEIIMVECWYGEQGDQQWEGAARTVRLLVDTAPSRPTVIGVSGAPNSTATEWSMTLFGKGAAAESLADSACTTVTATSSTIASRTLNWFRTLPTRESTAAANGAATNGGSRAGTAELGILCLTTTSGRLASALGVGPAALPMRLRISASAGRSGHPTVKPCSLMRYLCRLVTPPNGLICDPFAGSGSTGKAAVAEGFRFAGIELDAEYCEIARRRIEAVLTQGRLAL